MNTETQEVPRFILEQVINNDSEALKLSEYVKSRGYAIIRITKEYTSVFEKVFAMMEQFYNKPYRGN